MNSYQVRWGGVVLLAGAWIAAMFASAPVGLSVHLLAVAAVALTFVQLRTRPALSSFEVWQAQQASRSAGSRRR